ncbi:MAG: 5-bromo-4-chloroindolyl phosphate hydrolysis family protein [Lachnospiraceae bacterium]|nr:5-bromo-4-chloroindolyl phosphate hydrolysis family protein [Lachnospiraceae bacterium]
MKEVLRTIGSAAVAVLFFFFLYSGMAFAAMPAAALSVGMYFGAYYLMKPRNKIGRIEVETMRDGIGSMKLMEEADKDIKSMEKAAPRIKDPAVAGDVRGLIATGRKILAYLTDHPEKIGSAHRFADYYLDMAAKLVDKYVDLEKTDMDEGSVANVMGQTKDALTALNRAFDKQLTRLMEGELMDVEADIRVLQETLKMEGDS